MTNNNKNELSRFISGYSCEGNNKRFMKEKEHKRQKRYQNIVRVNNNNKHRLFRLIRFVERDG